VSFFCKKLPACGGRTKTGLTRRRGGAEKAKAGNAAHMNDIKKMKIKKLKSRKQP
jgi:hypothetical protein